MPIIKMPSAPIRNDRKNEPNIEPVLPNGFAMKLLNAKKIGMKDKRKRRNPTIRNAIPSCRSRGPDSPKSVAPPSIAALGPPTILAPAFDGQPQDEALRGKSHGSVGAGSFNPGHRYSPARLRHTTAATIDIDTTSGLY